MEVLTACQARRRAVDLGDCIHLPIPGSERTNHEAHFAEVLGEFTGHFRNRVGIPAWERPNLRAKYYITTRAVELARVG